MPTTMDARGLLARRGLGDRVEDRQRMVMRLRRLGIRDPVLSAMAAVPRHAFAPRHLACQAYAWRSIRIGSTSLTEPYCVALMTQALGLRSTDTVLEIGTGTGYQTTILAVLARHVFTVERVPSLVAQSKERFEALRLCNVSQRLSDGYLGWPEAAPFDAIIVTAAAPTIPPVLVHQLDPRGGRMVLPVGPSCGPHRLCLVRRRAERLDRTDLRSTRFLPLLPGAPRDSFPDLPHCGQPRPS